LEFFNARILIVEITALVLPQLSVSKRVPIEVNSDKRPIRGCNVYFTTFQAYSVGYNSNMEGFNLLAKKKKKNSKKKNHCTEFAKLKCVQIKKTVPQSNNINSSRGKIAIWGTVKKISVCFELSRLILAKAFLYINNQCWSRTMRYHTLRKTIYYDGFTIKSIPY
jgi:hypothetical protein